MSLADEPGKRGSDALVVSESAKKARTEGGALVASGGGGALTTAGPQRTSELLAPIMLLTGHSGAVLTAKFSPDGRHLISGSHDKTLLLWEVFGQCGNTLTFHGHKNAVLEAHWIPDGEHAVSASADKTLALWDCRTGARSRQFKGHSAFVNTCCPSGGSSLMASGSDDCSARLWDVRVRVCQRVIKHPFPVTSVVVNSTGHNLYTGCLDGIIREYDLRRPDTGIDMMLKGHQDIISGMSLSADDNYLLSNAMDNTVRCWDVKPYASGDRCVKVFLGAQHNYEKGLLKCNWSRNGAQVAAGSADNFVYVWDATTRRILYKLPGHSGSINEVHFHPTQPIICSCSNDKQIYLGEIRASS